MPGYRHNLTREDKSRIAQDILTRQFLELYPEMTETEARAKVLAIAEQAEKKRILL